VKRIWTFDRMLLVLWCLLLAGQGLSRPGFLDGTGIRSLGPGHPPSMGRGPASPGWGQTPLHPRFTPVASVPVISIDGAPGGVSLPPPSGFPGAFGQTSGAFSPPPPTSLGVTPPSVVTIPQVTLGQGAGAFSPALPQLSIVPLAGNAVSTSTGGGIPLFVPFALGPTAILNQFVQPPLIPFGQVGIQPVAYLPGFFTGNANPFNRTCNYYFFAGCGASGGAVADFNFSSR